MLSTDERHELLRAMDKARTRLAESVEQAVASVRSDSAADIVPIALVNTALAPLDELIGKLTRMDELEQASYFGDAYQLTEVAGLPGVWDVPDRVKGSPTLVMHMQLYPKETDPGTAVQRFKENTLNAPPVLIRGRCEGIKELVCRFIHMFYGLSKGDL